MESWLPQLPHISLLGAEDTAFFLMTLKPLFIHLAIVFISHYCAKLNKNVFLPHADFKPVQFYTETHTEAKKVLKRKIEKYGGDQEGR